MWFRYIGLPCMLYLFRPNIAYISKHKSSQKCIFDIEVYIVVILKIKELH